jgi:hypothetical protein
MGLKHVRLSIEVPPTSWVQELGEIDGVRIRIVDCVLHEDGSIMHLISVETPDKKTAENVKNILRASKFVDEAFFAEGNAASFIGFVKTKRCTICGVFANRCFVRRGTYDISRGRIVWRLVAHEREIPHVIDGLQAQGTAFELLESVEAKPSNQTNPQPNSWLQPSRKAISTSHAESQHVSWLTDSAKHLQRSR